MKTIVKRALWHRGKSSNGSMLLTGEGKMCCIGFTCLQGGMKESDILRVTSPSVLFEHEYVFPADLAWLVNSRYMENTDRCTQAMVCNDDTAISATDREEQLKQIYAAAGHEIEFED